MSFEAPNSPTELLYQVNTRRVQASTRRQIRAPSASGRGAAKCNKAAGEHLGWGKTKVKKTPPQLSNLCNCLPIFLYCLQAKEDLALCVPTIISHFGGHPVISLPDRGAQAPSALSSQFRKVNSVCSVLSKVQLNMVQLTFTSSQPSILSLILPGLQ